jgi:hypothetical protein
VGNFLTSCKPVSFSRRTLHHGVSNKILLLIYAKNNEICGACMVNGAAAKCIKMQSGILREHDILEIYIKLGGIL